MKSGIQISSLAFLIVFSCNTENKKEITPEIESKEEAPPERGVVVFKDSLGRSLTAGDLANVTTGEVDYAIMDNEPINPEAQKLHNEARELGQSGKYDLAIEKLQQAIKVQPAWAYPSYDLAFTYLLKGDADNALKYYKHVDELKPKGFFTTKTALYALEGEKAGKFPKGTYRMYMQIEWEDNANKKLQIAKMLTEKAPGFAPAWKEIALLSDGEEKLIALEQGLSKKPDPDTKGILVINKALTLNLVGQTEDAKKLLGNLIFSADATLSNIETAKFVLKSISGLQ